MRFIIQWNGKSNNGICGGQITIKAETYINAVKILKSELLEDGIILKDCYKVNKK